MSDRTELALHALGGFVLALLELEAAGSAVMALFWPTLLSWSRESEQAREKRQAHNALTGRRIRPSDVRYWSAHKWREFLAFPLGALVAIGARAMG